MVDKTRKQMMLDLFGELSEDEEEQEKEEEVDSEHSATAIAANHSEYQSDEGKHEGGIDDAEGEGETEGQREVEMDSEAEAHDVDAEVESERERAQSSPQREISAQKMESPKYAEVRTSRRAVVACESDESGNNTGNQGAVSKNHIDTHA